MKKLPHKRQYPWKRNVVEIKGHEPTPANPLGTCTECGKQAFTQWLTRDGNVTRVQVQLCKEHNDQFEKESQEERVRLGLGRDKNNARVEVRNPGGRPARAPS